MAMNKNDVRQIIKTTLLYIDKYSEDAEELLMLTAAVESGLGTYMYQVNGPARGIFQMEPATENDCWKNYLNLRNDAYIEKIKNLKFSGLDNLPYNLAYQVALCRVHCLRVTEAIPPKTDVKALAEYWKKYYNTVKGKGTVDKAVKEYKRLVL